MDESLQKALLDMEANDKALHAELAAAGEINESFHPRVEELHRVHSSRLRQMIAVFGWPGRSLVGEPGARASWRIAMHSYAEPAFMRLCRDHIDRATLSNDAPRWQFALLDDRIRVFEGKPQRYGTQLRQGAGGIEPYPLEDESRVNSMRMQAGLPPLARFLAQARTQPPVPAAIVEARESAELEFRRYAGWLSG
jgi:hypothetical protein